MGGYIWIIASALVLFLSFEIEIGDGPGPELVNLPELKIEFAFFEDEFRIHKQRMFLQLMKYLFHV